MYEQVVMMGLVLQVYRQPIPMDSLVLDEDAQSKAGSFRSAFSHNNTANSKFSYLALNCQAENANWHVCAET